MGCCAWWKNRGAAAYRQNDISEDLLEEVRTKTKELQNVVVFTVMLQSCSNLKAVNGYQGGSDIFVELKLAPLVGSVLPPDEVGGPQKQISPIKPNTINPTWQPPERFRFVVNKHKDRKIILSIYHYNGSSHKESLAIGDGIVKLKDCFTEDVITARLTTEKTIKLTEPSGSPAGEAKFIILAESLFEASCYDFHTVYENQRYHLTRAWNEQGDPNDNLLPTDRGRWSTDDGKKYGDMIEKVAPPVPDEFFIEHDWHTVATDEDGSGWSYAFDFDSSYWYPTNPNNMYFTRRRAWHRVIRKKPEVIAQLQANAKEQGYSAPATTSSTTATATTTRNSSVSSDTGNGNNAGRRKRLFDKK